MTTRFFALRTRIRFVCYASNLLRPYPGEGVAGILYRKGVLRRGRLSLCIFGVIASTIIYGGIMNPASALMWSQTVNWKIIISYYITGIPVDLVRAAATFFFLWLGAEPKLEKLDRIKVKYGLVY